MAQARTTAIVTPSYIGDLERCRLLCETVDRFVTGFDRHYILVASADVAAFRSLEGPRRVVIDERDLLPHWLHAFRDPFLKFRKQVWLSTRTLPLHGWHVQQLRRIAIAGHAEEDALFYCDSDVAFLRPFDCATLWHGDDLRLFRRDDDLLNKPELVDQRIWAENAGKVLGLAEEPRHDYIATLIAWRRDSVLRLCRKLEDVSGRHWVSAIGTTRRFSECMIYGRFVDEVMGAAGHFHASRDLCRVYWFSPAPSEEAFREFVAAMAPEQVAIGMQSFIGADLEMTRRLISA